MRRNAFVRPRRYDQRPQIIEGWYMTHPLFGDVHASRHNPHYARDLRMQSWRRPL